MCAFWYFFQFIGCLYHLFLLCLTHTHEHLHSSTLSLSQLLCKSPESTNPQHLNRLRKCASKQINEWTRIFFLSLTLSLSHPPVIICFALIFNCYKTLCVFMRTIIYLFLLVCSLHILVHCHTLNWWIEWKKREVRNGATLF